MLTCRLSIYAHDLDNFVCRYLDKLRTPYTGYICMLTFRLSIYAHDLGNVVFRYLDNLRMPLKVIDACSYVGNLCMPLFRQQVIIHVCSLFR